MRADEAGWSQYVALSKLRDVLEGLTPLTAARGLSSVELWAGDPSRYEGQLAAWVADVTERVRAVA